MRFRFSVALSASFITALLAEWPEENLFDMSDSLAETDSSFNIDDSFRDLFQPTVTTDLSEDDSSLALQCTSSDPGELMRKAKIRREEELCPSPIYSGDADRFNMEMRLRARIEAIQELARRQRRALPFCPPPTQPLCCTSEPEYLGMEVHDCQLFDPLALACVDPINIYCCMSYGSYMGTTVDIDTGISSNMQIFYGSICTRVFGLPMID